VLLVLNIRVVLQQVLVDLRVSGKAGGSEPTNGAWHLSHRSSGGRKHSGGEKKKKEKEVDELREILEIYILLEDGGTR